MRKILFYVWCIGGVIIFYLAMKFTVKQMNTEVAFGFGAGVLFACACFYLNERIDRARHRGDGPIN